VKKIERDIHFCAGSKNGNIMFQLQQGLNVPQLLGEKLFNLGPHKITIFGEYLPENRRARSW
jgi:hypothetical protein